MTESQEAPTRETQDERFQRHLAEMDARLENGPFTDWRGTPIKEGSTIIYPGRGSSSMWLVEGTVMEIIPDSPDDSRLRHPQAWQDEYYPPGRRFTLLVQPTRQNGGYRQSDRPVKVGVVSRVTVVH